MTHSRSSNAWLQSPTPGFATARRGSGAERTRDVPATANAARPDDGAWRADPGRNQKGTPEGYRLRGHHWTERWVTDRAGQRRMVELFVTGELLAVGSRAVLEVMLHESTR